jgi:hypothetical protein
MLSQINSFLDGLFGPICARTALLIFCVTGLNALTACMLARVESLRWGTFTTVGKEVRI